MKRIAIQLDKNTVRQAEDFVAAICYENHLDNYHATIAVPVLNAVEQMLHCQESRADVAPVSIEYGYSQNGIYFTITGHDKCFSDSVSDFIFASDSQPDTVSLARMLADEVEVLEEGKSLRMVFHVRGIDANESRRRMSILNHFYAPALVVA